MSYNKAELLQLPVEEKISLVADLWDSIDEQKQPLADWKKELIKQRISSDKANPDLGTEWHVLREKYIK